ncbi:MAG: YdcF family protein [Kiritimatiellia bacterium]
MLAQKKKENAVFSDEKKQIVPRIPGMDTKGGRWTLWWIVLRLVVIVLAAVTVLQFGIGLFGLPRSLTDWLCGKDLKLNADPRWIVVLGGSGIPSASGLMRTYYGAEIAARYPRATVIVALPAIGDPESGSVGRMKGELILRGIPWSRVRMETEGRNTHEQALGVRRIVGEDDLKDPLLVITSPYHVRRSVLCFRAVGFRNVGGIPALAVAAEDDFPKQPQQVSVGSRIALLVRYGFWRNLQLLPEALRECVALSVYRFRGWL